LRNWVGSGPVNSDADLTNSRGVINLELELHHEFGSRRSGCRRYLHSHELGLSIRVSKWAGMNLLAEIDWVEISAVESLDESLHSDYITSNIACEPCSLGFEPTAELSTSTDDAHVEDFVQQSVETLLSKRDAWLAERFALLLGIGLDEGDDRCILLAGCCPGEASATPAHAITRVVSLQGLAISILVSVLLAILVAPAAGVLLVVW